MQPRRRRAAKERLPRTARPAAFPETGFTSRLIENRGTISLTAQEPGVLRVALYGKLKKYGISAATRDGEDSPDAADCGGKPASAAFSRERGGSGRTLPGRVHANKE